MAYVCNVCLQRSTSLSGFVRHGKKCKFIVANCFAPDVFADNMRFDMPDHDDVVPAIFLEDLPVEPVIEHCPEHDNVTQPFRGASYLLDQMNAVDFDANDGSALLVDQTERDNVLLQLSKFIEDVGLSQLGTQQLLDLLKSGVDISLLPKSAVTLCKWTTQALSRARIFTGARCDEVHEVDFDTSEVNKLKPKVTFYFRNPRTALISLLLRHARDKRTRINFHFKERKDPVTGERVWWGDDSGTWWQYFQTHYLLPNCVPLVFKLFSDGTQTLTNCHACPLTFTLANLDPADQAKSTGKILIGYIPYIESDGECSEHTVTQLRYRLYHFCMRTLALYLWPTGEQWTEVLVRGEVLSLQIVCKNLIMDGPEARKAALIASQCIYCRRARTTFNYVSDDDAEKFEEESEVESEVNTFLNLQSCLYSLCS
jgi:hypothetical protein